MEPESEPAWLTTTAAPTLEEPVIPFTEFQNDIARGGFPEAGHIVRMDPEERDAFLKGIGA